jgi:hypothetical protein
MDNRYSFVSLFIDKGCPIYLSGASYSVLSELKSFWKGLGFTLAEYKDCGEKSFLYFYKRRFFSRVSEFSGKVSEYIIVPGIDNPRWLILNSKKAIQNHGSIIKPTSLNARTVWVIAKWLNSFGLFAFIFPHRMVVAGSFLESFYSNENLTAAILYTGAPGKYQKFTFQYSDSKNKPVSFMKVSNTASGIKRIENEKKALIKLGDISFDRIITPNLLSVLRKNEFYGLVQDNILSNEGVSVNLSKVDLKAICEIHEKFNFKEVSLSEYFNEVGLYDQIKCLPEVKDYLSSANNRKILLALSHGDYIPWNRFLSKDKIKLIDWETFKYRPLFYDVCYFLLHKVVLVEKLKGQSVITESISAINELLCVFNCEKQSLENIDVKFYLLINFIELYVHYKKNNHSADQHLLKALEYILLDLIEYQAI